MNCERLAKNFGSLRNFVKAVFSYFSLAESGTDLKLRNVSVQKLLSDIIDWKRGAVENAGLEIVSILRETPDIKADPEYFREMVMIFLDNAAVFSEPGGVITVENEAHGEKNQTDCQ